MGGPTSPRLSITKERGKIYYRGRGLQMSLILTLFSYAYAQSTLLISNKVSYVWVVVVLNAFS